jgi:hypothetical protein
MIGVQSAAAGPGPLRTLLRQRGYHRQAKWLRAHRSNGPSLCHIVNKPLSK